MHANECPTSNPSINLTQVGVTMKALNSMLNHIAFAVNHYHPSVLQLFQILGENVSIETSQL